jgi:hypothetical protein
MRYALAIADPWADLAMGVCVPVASGVTQKVHGFIRGTSIIGTAGYAFILATPALSSDLPSLYVSGAAYAGSDMVPLSAANTLSVGVSRINCGNLPYIAANFVGEDAAPSVAGRVVASGLRAWYTGTELERSGVTYCLRDPTHNNVSISPITGVAADIPSVGFRRETGVENFSRSYCSVSDFAFNASETVIHPMSPNLGASITGSRTLALYPFSGGDPGTVDAIGTPIIDTIPVGNPAGVRVGSPTSCIQFTGVAGQSFSYEYMVHLEYNGQLATVVGTKTDADAVGTQVVMEAAAVTQVMRQSAERASVWGIMYDAIREIASGTKEFVVPAAIAGLRAMLL